MLTQQGEDKGAFLAGLGFEELRLPLAVRPGDTISCMSECIEKRDSKSKPNCGIIRFNAELYNQKGDIVLSSKSASLIAKKSFYK